MQSLRQDCSLSNILYVLSKCSRKVLLLNFITQYREFIKSHENNIKVVTWRVLYNELLQTTKSSSNQQLLTMIIQTWPEESAKVNTQLVARI